MKNLILFNLLGAMLFAASSCDPNPLPLPYGDSAEGERTLRLNIVAGSEPQSKSSLGAGVESLFTGAVLGIYDSSSGLLESEIEIPAEKLGGSVLVTLPAGRVYDFYLLGNLRYIASDGSGRLPSLPSTSGELESFSYRLDGAAAASGLRRENFSEVSRWGIPLCWSRRGVDPFTEGSVDIEMERLFAKLVLTIDHSGLAGTQLEGFRNGSVHIRQSNCVLRPFSPEGSRALSQADIIPVSDYESTMENGQNREVVFYVPENLQGTLMPGNTDPSEKDIEGVEEACGDSGVSALLSYLEFRGRLDGAQLGFDGEVVYRFFLGRNATDNFDVERNSELRVSLGFRPESIFDPDWKVDSDGVDDSREFFLSGKLAGRLPEGKEIVVRKNRPGTFDLNIVLAEGGANKIVSASLVNGDYEPSSLADLAWTSDFWAAGHKAEDEPRRAELEKYGISVNYSGGSFTFSVSDPSKFVTGARIPLKLTLLPGSVETTAVIVTGEDISVEESSGKSLYEDFFLAQHRSLSFRGFAGKKIYYMADQDEVRRGGSGRHTYNIQWKTGRHDEDAFAYCRTDASDNPVYPYQDYESYSSQCLGTGERLDVFAFFPNNFYRGNRPSADGCIYICSDDIHNDGLTAVPLRIRMPYFKTENVGNEMLYFLFDGSEIPVEEGYYTADGGERLMPSDFDDELYGRLLALEFDWTNTRREKWIDCLKISDDQESMYLYRTTSEGKGIEEEIKGLSMLGRMKICPSSSTGLYDGVASKNYECYVSVPHYLDGPYLQGGEFFYTAADTRIGARVRLQYPRCDPAVVECSEEGPTVVYRTGTGETVRPVMELEYDGMELSLVFDEAEQPMTDKRGEFVPGGLLVPYGDHNMSMKVTNKWDGRSLEFSFDFTFNYKLILGQFAIFRPTKTATVYFTGAKNAKYLEKYGAGADWNDIEFMLKILGSDEWQSHVSVQNGYLFDKKYHIGPKNYTGPAEDFEVSFISPAASRWTPSLAEEAFGALWLNGLSFHKNGVPVDGQPVSDVEITGHRNLTSLFIGTTNVGYIFRNKTYF